MSHLWIRSPQPLAPGQGQIRVVVHPLKVSLEVVPDPLHRDAAKHGRSENYHRNGATGPARLQYGDMRVRHCPHTISPEKITTYLHDRSIVLYILCATNVQYRREYDHDRESSHDIPERHEIPDPEAAHKGDLPQLGHVVDQSPILVEISMPSGSGKIPIGVVERDRSVRH